MDYQLFCEDAERLYVNTLDKLETTLGRKRAKESARYFLPYGNQLTLDVSFNFRSFMHFVNLRADEHAQKEIQDIANQMVQLVRDIHEFDLSLKAFGC